jgi:alkylation response protein AidB-like acyl-CoA dehydrogenase
MPWPPPTHIVSTPIPHTAAYEADERYPEEAFRVLGRSGLLGLPYPEEVGGQPYEVYLQVLEELGARWRSR